MPIFENFTLKILYDRPSAKFLLLKFPSYLVLHNPSIHKLYLNNIYIGMVLATLGHRPHPLARKMVWWILGRILRLRNPIKRSRCKGLTEWASHKTFEHRLKTLANRLILCQKHSRETYYYYACQLVGRHLNTSFPWTRDWWLTLQFSDGLYRSLLR